MPPSELNMEERTRTSCQYSRHAPPSVSQAVTHTTEQMTHRHYLKRVSHEDGVAYFDLKPVVVFSWRTPKTEQGTQMPQR